MDGLGFKQEWVLNEFKKRGKMSISAVKRIYANPHQAMNCIRTLEMKGYIKKSVQMGYWELKR